MTVRGDKDFLGQGWSFPPTFERDAGAVDMVRAETDIVQSLHILFSTAKTERLMLPDYGCDLSELCFDGIDHVLVVRLRELLLAAILFHEPRISVSESDIDIVADEHAPGRLLVRLGYTVRQTNTRSNMVYPFYLDEGSNARRIGTS
jgi:phage baseplate assembly protein W